MSKRCTLYFQLHQQRLRWICYDTLVHPSVFLSGLTNFNCPVLFVRPGIPENPLRCHVSLFLALCVFVRLEKHHTFFLSLPDNRGWFCFSGREKFSNLAWKRDIIRSFYFDDLPFLKNWGCWEEKKLSLLIDFRSLRLKVINEMMFDKLPSLLRKPNLPHESWMFCSTSHDPLFYSLPAHTCTVRCQWYLCFWGSRCHSSPPVCASAVSEQTWSSRCM